MKGTCMVGIMKKPRKSRELSNNVQRGVKAVMQRTAAPAAAAGAAGPAGSGAAKAGAGGKGGSGGRPAAAAGAGAAAPGAAGGSRKRKPRCAAAAAAANDGANTATAGQVAAAEQAQQQADVEMADAEAPPAKQPRRTNGPSTRRQYQALLAVAAAAEAENAVDVGDTAGRGGGDAAGSGPSQPEGSSQSQTDAHEGEVASQQPARSSLTAASQPAEAGRPACGAGSTGGVAGGGGGGGVGGAHSFRSSSGVGMSGAALEGSMGQVCFAPACWFPVAGGAGSSAGSSCSRARRGASGIYFWAFSKPLRAWPLQAASSKLRLQLMPLDSATTASMAAAGYHPFLELTLSTSKSLLSVLRHLGGKWQQAVPAAGKGGGAGGAPAIFVHPPASCPITLRGMSWGGPECDAQLKVGRGRPWWWAFCFWLLSIARAAPGASGPLGLA